VLRDGRYVGTPWPGPRGGGADPLDDWSRAEQAVPGPAERNWRRAAGGQRALGAEAWSGIDEGGIVAGPGRLPSRSRRRDRRACRLAGLRQYELLRGIFGAYGRLQQGKVSIDGERFEIQSPRRSVQQGVAYLTSDRKGTASFSAWTSRKTSPSRRSSPCLRLFGCGIPWNGRSPSARPCARDPGGRRQAGSRHAFGREPAEGRPGEWIETRPRVLLLDEPTRGVDVGSKHEIYELMTQWTKDGFAILMITSEMPELLGLADRIVVMHRGRVTAQLGRAEATQEKVLKAAMADERA